MRYRMTEEGGKGKADVEDELFELQNILKERELDIEELQNLIQQSERKYVTTNSHFEKLIQDAESRYQQM